jgi:hypothetical protein
MTDEQKLEQLFSEQEYLVLAVTLDDGTPWAVPVRMRTGDGKVFEWDSHLLAEHSKAIAKRPAAAVTIFQKWDDHQTGYYAKGTAQMIEEFKPGFGHYRFSAQQAWINDETFRKREIEL